MTTLVQIQNTIFNKDNIVFAQIDAESNKVTVSTVTGKNSDLAFSGGASRNKIVRALLALGLINLGEYLVNPLYVNTVVISADKSSLEIDFSIDDKLTVETGSSRDCNKKVAALTNSSEDASVEAEDTEEN
jgi:hypothetical protein